MFFVLKTEHKFSAVSLQIQNPTSTPELSSYCRKEIREHCFHIYRNLQRDSICTCKKLFWCTPACLSFLCRRHCFWWQGWLRSWYVSTILLFTLSLWKTFLWSSIRTFLKLFLSDAEHFWCEFWKIERCAAAWESNDDHKKNVERVWLTTQGNNSKLRTQVC